MKRDNFFLQIVKCYLNLFFAFIMCFMLSMTIMVFNGYKLVIFVIQAFCLAIPLLLLGNYAWKDGKHEIDLVKFHNYAPVSPFRWICLGLISTLPYEILTVLLTLSKCGILISKEFGAAYKILESIFLPLTALYAKPAGDFVNSDDYPWWLIIVLYILPLLIPITMAITHKISFDDKIDSDTIVYKDIKK